MYFLKVFTIMHTEHHICNTKRHAFLSREDYIEKKVFLGENRVQPGLYKGLSFFS
jgi:hypothetical protein